VTRLFIVHTLVSNGQCFTTPANFRLDNERQDTPTFISSLYMTTSTFTPNTPTKERRSKTASLLILSIFSYFILMGGFQIVGMVPDRMLVCISSPLLSPRVISLTVCALQSWYPDVCTWQTLRRGQGKRPPQSCDTIGRFAAQIGSILWPRTRSSHSHIPLRRQRREGRLNLPLCIGPTLSALSSAQNTLPCTLAAAEMRQLETTPQILSKWQP
jgi:hypothetical protein